MNITLLTTDTTHHLYYALKISEQYPLKTIFLETRTVDPGMDTSHPFEDIQDEYDRSELLNGSSLSIDQIAETVRYQSINEPSAVQKLRTISADVVIVFGTGLLKAEILNAAPAAYLNLHGGNPETYRGLDTHLWAVYHDDFENLVTTLHFMDEELDTGPIIFQQQLKPITGSELFQLRATNTKACVQLSLMALNITANNGSLPSRTQVKRGRYYSFMPTALKEICVKKYHNKYISR